MDKPTLSTNAYLNPLRRHMYQGYLPSAFDSELTILEKLNCVVDYANEIGILTGEMLEDWENFSVWLGEQGLSEELEKMFDEWLKTINFDADMETLKSQMKERMEIVNKLKDGLGALTMSGASGIYQNFMMKPFFGTLTEQIFDGAERAPQGMAYVEFEGHKYIFILSKVSGETWTQAEKHRITQFELEDNGGVGYVQPLTFTKPFNLGHQGISAIVENGKIFLFTAYGHGDGLDNGKGYCKIEWNGSNTDECDISRYLLMGDTNSNDQYNFLNHCTPTVSTSGKYVVFTCATTFATNGRYMIIFDRKQVENAPNSLKVKALNQTVIQPPEFVDTHIGQDLACDDNFVYLYTSGVAPLLAKTITIYSVQGYRIGDYQVDGSLGEYTSASQLVNDPIYGDATQMEAEGIAIYGNDLLILSTNVWEKDGQYTRRDKNIHRIHKGCDCDNSKPINAGLQPKRSPATLHLKGTTMDLSYPFGDTLQFGTYNEKTGELRNSFSYWGSHHMRLYDGRDGSDNTKFGYIGVTKTGSRSFMEIRSRDENNPDNLMLGGGINLYGTDDNNGAGPASIIMYSVGADNTVYNVRIQETGQWRPGTDAMQSLGTASYRWKNIYASTTAITTSDENYKQQIGEIPDEVLDAWEEVEFKRFKYNEAVESKGDENSRFHIGLIAQSVQKAFEKHGLNAFDYGLLTRDSWDAQEEINDNGLITQEAREAGEIWGIRAEECLFLESAVMRRKTKMLEAKLNELLSK